VCQRSEQLRISVELQSEPRGWSIAGLGQEVQENFRATSNPKSDFREAPLGEELTIRLRIEREKTRRIADQLERDGAGIFTKADAAVAEPTLEEQHAEPAYVLGSPAELHTEEK
jgi:hypothetical protein